MKKLFLFFRRNWWPLIVGGSLVFFISAICPVFTFGFWKVAYASECAIGFVGIGGSPAPDSLISSAIGASPTGKLCYRLMYRIGSAQGKVYAVMGMRYLDYDEFVRMRDALVLEPGRVLVHAGCMVSSDTFESVLFWEEGMRYGDDDLRKSELGRLEAHFKELKKQKPEAANQALVPTPASVTPAAGAPVAPDAGAAHL